MKNNSIQLKDIIEVDIFAPRSGKYPIGRFRGIICKLEIPKSIGHIDYGCSCICMVKDIQPKYMVVEIQGISRSALHNAIDTKLSIDLLKGLNTKPSKFIKPKKGINNYGKDN